MGIEVSSDNNNRRILVFNLILIYFGTDIKVPSFHKGLYMLYILYRVIFQACLLPFFYFNTQLTIQFGFFKFSSMLIRTIFSVI